MIDLSAARRIAVAAQRLSGPAPGKDIEAVQATARALNCLQLDPTSAVARNQYLVLWSRLGNYDPALLDRVCWEERTMFEYWAHAASLVMTEDFPLHEPLMRAYRRGNRSWYLQVRSWVEANKKLKTHILREIKRNGPLPSRHFADLSDKAWQSSGWTNDRNVGRMLDYLWTQGYILVATRRGQTRFWDLADRVLPDWTPRERLSDAEVLRGTTELALRSLGIGNERQIGNHFVRRRARKVGPALDRLERDGIAHRITVSEGGAPFPEPWWVHSDYLEFLEDGSRKTSRTTLLSPFDNLICDRERTEQLFDFHFRLEIYTPKAKRVYGYFVMPILHGDRLVGRADLAADRKGGVLQVHAVYAEDGAPARAGAGLRRALKDLAAFCGTESIRISGAVPPVWRKSFRAA